MTKRTVVCDLRFTFVTEGNNEVDPAKYDIFANKLAKMFSEFDLGETVSIADVTPIHDPETQQVAVKTFDMEVDAE